jgi:4'-phosphopantetheinyl transferase
LIDDSDPRWTGPVWSHFTPNRSPEKGDVHVWLADLEDPGVDLECYTECLSLAERARAAQFKFALHRQRYLIAHGALRSILGMYLGVDAAAIDFESGAAGKPKLARHLSRGAFEFNLSHSGGVALIAVARGTEVGIDVERIQEDFPFLSVAQRFFSHDEVAVLKNLPTGLQRETFYKCWTSKEALLKAKGTGLSGPLDEVEIVLTATGVRITPLTQSWALTEVSSIRGYAAALALEMPQYSLECYRWAVSMLFRGNRP